MLSDSVHVILNASTRRAFLDDKTDGKRTFVRVPADLVPEKNYQTEIGLAEGLDAGRLVDLARTFTLNQIVQSATPGFAAETDCAEIMLKESDRFLSSPLSTILDPARAGETREAELRSFSKTFRKLSDKSPLIEEIREHVFAVSKSEGITTNVCLAADELLTNAIYNAPHARFRGTNPNVPRSSEFGELEGLRPGEIFLGADAHRIVIGCSDLYGSLDPSALIERLRRCYANGTESVMNKGQGGAGIGTFMMFENCLSMYIGVKPHRRTVACYSYSLERRARVRSELPKNLHIFSQEESP